MLQGITALEPVSCRWPMQEASVRVNLDSVTLKNEIQGEDMGVHKRGREMDDLKEHYIKKSSCILFVLMALLVGAFIGNTATMLYLGQQGQGPSRSVASSGPAVDAPHTADPAAQIGRAHV